MDSDNSKFQERLSQFDEIIKQNRSISSSEYQNQNRYVNQREVIAFMEAKAQVLTLYDSKKEVDKACDNDDVTTSSCQYARNKFLRELGRTKSYIRDSSVWQKWLEKQNN